MSYVIWKFDGTVFHGTVLDKFENIFHQELYNHILVVADDKNKAVDKVMTALKFAC